MPKAADSFTTAASDSDAKLLASIEHLAELHRRNDDHKPPADREGTDIFLAVMKTEHELSSEPVFSTKAFNAKCKVIEECCWDLDDLLIIAYLLGRDAERLGIKKIPAFIRNRQGETWPGSMKRRVDMSADYYAEKLAAAAAI